MAAGLEEWNIFCNRCQVAMANGRSPPQPSLLRMHASTREPSDSIPDFIAPQNLSPTLSLSVSTMDPDDEAGFLDPKPPDLFNKLVFLQADLISNAMAFLFSPISTFLSLLSESFRRAEETKHTVDSAARKVPSDLAHRLSLLVRKLSYGLIGAALMCMVMIVLLVAAAAVGVAVVRFWVEEPVVMRERLHFDYTMPRPTAVFGLEYGSSGGGGGVERMRMMMKKKHLGIPVGHTFYASVVLFMPESDFNREVGVFQLNAELISTNGNVITRSSQPCMLRFRSLSVRMARTFLISLPLLLGITTESQKLSVNILKHKEVSHQRSGAIRVTLIPRGGTFALPELYEARIIINSQLPQLKELLRRWRWTCYLWVSLFLYLMFVVILLLFWKPVVFRAMTLIELGDYDKRAPMIKEAESSLDEMAEITVELLRKWQEMRRKRRASMFVYGEEHVVSTSASSISYSREYTTVGFEEDTGDSESVLLEGPEDE